MAKRLTTIFHAVDNVAGFQVSWSSPSEATYLSLGSCTMNTWQRLTTLLAGSMLIGLIVLSRPASAVRVVIDFEDLPAGPFGTPPRVSVNTQYADRGITFNNPDAFDFSDSSGYPPDFAHSGANAIETCFAIEFCTAPIEMTFTTPQTRVKAWVGLDLRGLNNFFSPLTVRLSVFDIGGREVGRATTAFAFTDPFGKIPIRTPLEVLSQSANIVRADLQLLLADGSVFITNPLAVDDVEFDTVPDIMEVTHIKFDHTGPDTNTSDGLNIRKDFRSDLAHKGNGVGDGEWIKGARNEPALYVANQTVTIQARITVAPDTITSADIEATARNGLLRNIVKRRVNFVNGVSSPEYVTFAFDGPTDATINKVVDSWEWKASNITGAGTNELFDESGPHTVYTILNVPKSPWYDNETQHPWVSALEFTIVTAQTVGITTIPSALSQVTTFLHFAYDLKYDTGEKEPHYTFPVPDVISHPLFLLTNFISETKTRDKLVNCNDLAAAVSTMSNLLGSASEYHYMQPFGFLNITSLIGIGSRCNNPSGSTRDTCLSPVDDAKRGFFGNHAFVQSPDVYDATVGPHLGMSLPISISTSIDRSTTDEAEKAGSRDDVRKEAATITLK